MDDLISRQQAIDEITEYGFGNTIYMSVAELKRRIEQLPSAQPEPCEDAVRREDVQAIAEKSDWFESSDSFNDFMWALYDLPSAQPERKKGEWIYGEDDGQDGWYCSECNGFVPWDYEFYGLDNIDFIRDFKTCPFCDTKMITYTGADMRGEQ